MDWIKLHTRSWIWGSGRHMSAEKRGVWVDLLACAGETKFRDGTLRHDVGIPMKIRWLANIINVEVHTLEACLEAYKNDINASDGQPRVTIWEDGTIQITNWHKYQDGPAPKIDRRPPRTPRGKVSDNPDKFTTGAYSDKVVTSKADVDAILKQREQQEG